MCAFFIRTFSSTQFQYPPTSFLEKILFIEERVKRGERKKIDEHGYTRFSNRRVAVRLALRNTTHRRAKGRFFIPKEYSNSLISSKLSRNIRRLITPWNFLSNLFKDKSSFTTFFYIFFNLFMYLFFHCLIFSTAVSWGISMQT